MVYSRTSWFFLCFFLGGGGGGGADHRGCVLKIICRSNQINIMV